MPTPDTAAEIRYLVARCAIILDAIERAEPEFTSLAAIRAVVAQTAAAGNVRGLRTVRRDLLEMSRALPLGDRDALRAALDMQAVEDPSARAAS